MQGQAQAPAAGTVLNALANGMGSAFAIDAYIEATVTLSDTPGIEGRITNAPDGDTQLIERCAEVVIDRFGSGEGATIETTSDVPLAAGLKSSSAAANAVVLATLDGLGVEIGTDIERVEAAKIGVDSARDVGVTVTGAFDDASASMLGGVTVTDNSQDTLLHRDPVEWDVLVWTPPEQAHTADAPVDRCQRLEPVADFIAETALNGRYADAMTINGFAFSAALDFSAEPLIEALPDATGVSLSGTGPSVTAIGDRDALLNVKDRWEEREGNTWLTRTQRTGARTK